jgi:hypothetical protein
MKLSEIKITPAFEASNPQECKLNKCRENYNKGIIDKKIVINRDNELVDGYILYLVLKENEVLSSKVKVINEGKRKHVIKKINNIKSNKSYWNSPTTYIYGKHYMDDDAKEYVWRMSKVNGKKNIEVGDELIANTKYGNRVITVTKIDVLDSRPVDMRIRKCWVKSY